MKTIPLFDDWMLDSHQDIVRRFGQAELCSHKVVCEDGDSTTFGGGYVNIIRDPESDVYKCWYPVSGEREIGGKNFNTFLCYLESEDGFNWTRPDLGFARQYGFDETTRNCVGFDVYPTTLSKVSLDPFDSDPARRYKLVAQHIEGHILDNNITGTIYVSPDGLDWKIVEGSRWYTNRMGSDCDNNLIFNPVTGRYQIICRPSCLDRRIAIVESADLVHWTDPLVVLHPDALDEPLMQFYSMTQYWHHDYFVGLMQRQHIASSEPSACKWLGKVDSELTYSFNGVHWNRADRQLFVPRSEPGGPGSEQLFTNSMVEQADGGLRFYSFGYDVEHYAEGPPEPVGTNVDVLVHAMRRDGFVYLEPRGGYGTFATRNLIPQNGQLRINMKAPNGFVWVQASDSRFRPLPGFSFDDCIPLCGDDTAAVPQWKDGKSAADLMGKAARLEFKLFQAQVYAIHWDFHIQYGDPVIERI